MYCLLVHKLSSAVVFEMTLNKLKTTRMETALQELEVQYEYKLKNILQRILPLEFSNADKYVELA